MINGVKIKEIVVHKDERGDFREIVKENDSLFSEIKQISISETKPGVIKAFHWHKNQDDIFYLIEGKIILVLYDARENSSTFKKTDKFILNSSNPKAIFIPRGVFHGYKALGEISSKMLYVMNNSYDPDNPDEERVSENDPRVNFGWELYE
jgi:dTDP-4-dehydrorhamnose 3,5-epimerase